VAQAQTSCTGRLDFLRSQDTSRVYVMDSSLAPVDLLGITLNPPYQRGLDQLTILGGLDGNLFVERAVSVAGGGRLTAFALSPDGDTAVVGRFFSTNPMGPHEAAIVRGLSTFAPHVSKVLPIAALEPHSVAISPDGSYALIGHAEFGPAALTVISGLPANPKIAGKIQLGLVPGFACDVESVKFSLDGKRVLVQTSLYDSPYPPIRFLPRVTLQVVFDPQPGGTQQVSAPFLLPRTPAIPPQPPFEGWDTGVALGDSALLPDGDSAIVPVSGAFELGQYDARILLVKGVRTGNLQVARTLGPTDGVILAPFQVVVAPDCDRAYVTSGNSFMVVSGLSDTSFANVVISPAMTSYWFPAEPAITPDGAALLINHPRVPVDNVPPGAAVTNYDPNSRTALGAPLFGPVRSLLFFKESCIQGHPSGLTDYVDLFTDDLPKGIGTSLRAKIHAAVRLSDRGRDRAARALLGAFRLQVKLLRCKGSLTGVEAGVLDDLAGLACSRLR
jgi:hypothetical protein